MALTEDKEKYLEKTANKIRQDIIKMLVEAGSGHSAGPLGMADIFTALYFNILNHNPKNPLWEDRDRLILSNGHIAPVQYATMARAGYFPVKELMTLRKLDTRLQGHPHRGALPGIEVTSGPLGSGLGQSCGIALAARLDRKKYRIYCLMSDGEHNSGIVWESVMFAAKERLSNITVIVDRNNIQIDGDTEDVMPLEPFREKYESFGWNVLEIDGHNFEQIIDSANEAKAIHDSPTVIIGHTIPGKGVDFMENDYRWHGSPPGKISNDPDAPPKSEQAKDALAQLRTLDGKIESEHE